MITEEKLVELIIDLEDMDTDPNDSEDDCYLDEAQQATLSAYYECLDRKLTQKELKKVQKLRKEYR